MSDFWWGIIVGASTTVVVAALFVWFVVLPPFVAIANGLLRGWGRR